MVDGNGKGLIQDPFSNEILAEIDPLHFLCCRSLIPQDSSFVVILGKYVGVNGKINAPKKKPMRENKLSSFIERMNFCLTRTLGDIHHMVNQSNLVSKDME